MKNKIILMLISLGLCLNIGYSFEENNNLNMNLAANPGGGGYIIEPKTEIEITKVVLHSGVNAQRVYIKDHITNTVLHQGSNNFNVSLDANTKYKIYVDSSGNAYNRYYVAQSYPFNTTNINYIKGWHNGLQVEQDTAFNIIGFDINTVENTTIEVPETTTQTQKKDIFVLIGQSNCNGQGETLNQLNPNSVTKVYNLNDEYLEASDKNYNINVNHEGTIFPIIANNFYTNNNYSFDYLMACVSGSRIDEWDKGSTNYNKMIEQVTELTNGSMIVKAILMVQGEAEAHQQNVNNYNVGYSEYKTKLNALSNDLNSDLNIESKKLFITVINREDSVTNTEYLKYIQNAQVDLINEENNIYLLADMREVGASIDGVHYMTDYEIGTFANKAYHNLNNELFLNQTIKINNHNLENGSYNHMITLNEEDNICLNKENINLFDIMKTIYMYIIYGEDS